jgi:hypothetical protein
MTYFPILRKQAPLLVAVLIFGSAGCSATSREYALPADLCGRPVDPALLKPFLPNGEKLEVKVVRDDVREKTCDFFVDGKRKLRIEEGLASIRPKSVLTGIWSRNGIGYKNPVDSLKVKGAVVADHSATVQVECTFPGMERAVAWDVEIIMDNFNEKKTKSRAADFERLLEPFVASFCDGRVWHPEF